MRTSTSTTYRTTANPFRLYNIQIVPQ